MNVTGFNTTEFIETETTEVNTTSQGTCCLCQFPENQGGQGCFLPDGSNDGECENEICPFDNYCCNSRWDDLCSAQAGTRCNNGNRPICCGCTIGQGGPNCVSDPECEDLICPDDLFCCGGDPQGIGFWDLICVNQALEICTDMINEGLPQQFVSERRRILDQELKGYRRA